MQKQKTEEHPLYGHPYEVDSLIRSDEKELLCFLYEFTHLMQTPG